MEACLCTISYRERLLEVALDAAAAIGFRAVELWGREPHVAEIYDESRIRSIREMLQERGLLAPVFGSYLTLGKTNPGDDEVCLLDTLHIAHGLKSGLVRVWAADVGSAEASEEVWAQTVAEARDASDKAAKMKMVFAVEMHDTTLADTADSALRLIEEVDRENFRLNFQVSYTTGEDQIERLEKVLPYVIHTHCQNFQPEAEGRDDKWVRTALDAGWVDYRELVARLRGAGYEGHLAVEFASQEGNGKEEALRRDLEFLSGL